MDIYPIQIPKALLDAAPEGERMLHLMAEQLVNDLNILTKLAHFALNPIAGHDDISERAHITTTMLLLKLLAGKVNEGWELVGGSRRSTINTRTTSAPLPKERLDELKKYCGRRTS